MNFTSPFSYQQNMAFLLSTLSTINQSLIFSSIQQSLPFPFRSALNEHPHKGLLDVVFGGKDSNKSQTEDEGQGLLLSTSPSSSNSNENSKGGIEEESENNASGFLKKPVFTITRQNKLSKSLSVESEEVKPSGNYNRKEKSLGELSRRFLALFGKIDECIISLDEVTKQLDVERRRVYDIINILESLGVVYRKSKNNYQWSGFNPIRETIRKLEMKSIDIKQEDVCDEGESSDDGDIVGQRLANKKEKSLAYLAGSFIKLFFSWKETIPLEEAAWKLSPKDTDDHKIKTKIRRLYDIANVFSSLGLIKKVTLDLDTRKPAFKWIGRDGLDEFVKDLGGERIDRFERNDSTTTTTTEEEPDLLTNIYNALISLPNNKNESLNKKRSASQNINGFEAKTKKKISPLK